MKRDEIEGSLGIVLVVVDSGDEFLMRRVVEASPRYSVVVATDAAARVLCGNRILRRDFPDAATIGMGSLIFCFPRCY